MMRIFRIFFTFRKSSFSDLLFGRIWFVWVMHANISQRTQFNAVTLDVSCCLSLLRFNDLCKFSWLVDFKPSLQLSKWIHHIWARKCWNLHRIRKWQTNCLKMWCNLIWSPTFCLKIYQQKFILLAPRPSPVIHSWTNMIVILWLKEDWKPIGCHAVSVIF